jgi:hypothetical protein
VKWEPSADVTQWTLKFAQQYFFSRTRERCLGDAQRHPSLQTIGQSFASADAQFTQNFFPGSPFNETHFDYTRLNDLLVEAPRNAGPRCYVWFTKRAAP